MSRQARGRDSHRVQTHGEVVMLGSGSPGEDMVFTANGMQQHSDLSRFHVLSRNKNSVSMAFEKKKKIPNLSEK